MNIQKKAIISGLTIIGSLTLSLTAGLFCLEKLAQNSIKNEVFLETGSEIRIEDFIYQPVTAVNFYTDVSQIDTMYPGVYSIQLYANFGLLKFKDSTILTIQDTTAPTATAVPQTTFTDELPDATDCVTDIVDLSDVIITYENEPDISRGGSYTIPVEVCDLSGNMSLIDVPFTVIDDHLAPLIFHAHDLEAMIGHSITYRDGIEVTDDWDPNPVLNVDTSNVDLNTPGTYPVIYTASDCHGNESFVEVNLTLREEPERYYEPEVLYELASNLNETYSIYDSDMTDTEKAFRIFNWVRSYIQYVGNSDKTDWSAAAYDGLTRLQGDCFTCYAVCKTFLDMEGIPNLLVERYPITWSAHYWNLVYLEGQWWHCDACYAWYHEGYYFMFSYEDLNHSDHGYDPTVYGPEINIAQESIQDRVNYDTLTVEPE